MTRTVRICDGHPDRPTILIWTFAFSGKEFWCPHCGYTSGMFGAGSEGECTPELLAQLQEDEKRSANYLMARACLVATEVKHNGVWMKPEDLPEDVKRMHAETIAAWKYEGASK